MSTFNVSLTWNGISANDPAEAVGVFQNYLDISLPPGTVLDVVNDETGEETEVEL